MSFRVERESTLRLSAGEPKWGTRYTADTQTLFHVQYGGSTDLTKEIAVIRNDTDTVYAYTYWSPESVKFVGNISQTNVFATLTYEPDGHFQSAVFWRSFAVDSPTFTVQAGLALLNTQRVAPYYVNAQTGEHNPAEQNEVTFRTQGSFAEMHDKRTDATLLRLGRKDVNCVVQEHELAPIHTVRHLEVVYHAQHIHGLLSGGFDIGEAMAFPEYFNDLHSIIFGKIHSLSEY